MSQLQLSFSLGIKEIAATYDGVSAKTRTCTHEPFLLLTHVCLQVCTPPCACVQEVLRYDPSIYCDYEEILLILYQRCCAANNNNNGTGKDILIIMVKFYDFKGFSSFGGGQGSYPRGTVTLRSQSFGSHISAAPKS